MTTPRSLSATLVGLAAFAAALFALAGEPQPWRPPAEPPAGIRYVPGELLVKFKRDTDVRARASVLASFGDRQLRAAAGGSGFALIKLHAERSMQQALAAYAAMPDVESVQPNYVYRFLAVPDDPHYGRLWALHNTGQAITGGVPAPAVPGADMALEQAWEEITDCRGVIVAVLDSGVNYTHRDLADNLWDGSAAGFPKHGFDFADNDDDPMPDDAFGHGNHIAGTIGAVGNNGVGMTGVCWQARLMAVRIGDRRGPTTAQIIQGMQFAVGNGAKVINLSLGGSARDPALEAEITSARNNGVVVVAAAGNDGTDNDSGTAPLYPCNFPQDNIICVAALDQAYERASFSNFGETSVDVGAPGTNILSAWPGIPIMDNLRGWTRTGGWAEVLCNFSVGALPALVNPGSWCAATPGQYAGGANDVAYKTFDLRGASHARANFFRFLATEPNKDFLGFAKSAAGGDPFATGTLLGQVSGAATNAAVEESLDLSDCFTGTCSFGFRLQSNASVNGAGVGIVMFEIDTVQPNSNAYRVLHGTSMATPHAAGVAALVWAYNPAYTHADVVNAVTRGGESVPALAGITRTGRAVDAAGSLRYISPPAGVTATVAPSP